MCGTDENKTSKGKRGWLCAELQTGEACPLVRRKQTTILIYSSTRSITALLCMSTEYEVYLHACTAITCGFPENTAVY